MQKNSIKFIIIHPILIALYPVFFVYSQNIHLILIQGIIFPVLIILGITIAMWAVIRSILKNARKSALLTSLFVFLFFSYGHIFNILESNLNQEYSFLIHTFLLITYALIAIFSTYYLVKTPTKLNNITTLANVISITLVSFVLFNIGTTNFENFSTYQDEIQPPIVLENDFENLPDVYYIVLDEYAPLRTLNMFYDYDNSHFIKFLQERGRLPSILSADAWEKRMAEGVLVPLGTRLRVWWEDEEAWFSGTVKAYVEDDDTHLVLYDDGDEQHEPLGFRRSCHVV